MDTEDPAPPPNPELLNSQPKWFKKVFYGCIVAAILFVANGLIGLVFPEVFRSRKKPYQTEATNNIRQISFALLEFDRDYGSYPNETTIPLVTKSDPSHGYDLSGSSSNALFRQFFAAKLANSEAIFYAKTQDGRKPDGVISTGEALKKGECGFSYISGLSSISADPLTPIVLTPLVPNTTTFDPKPFDGKAIILHIDNSIRSYKIAKDGYIYDDKGINLLSPENPIWKGKAPDIRYPDL